MRAPADAGVLAATIDSLRANIAILDHSGFIVAVNRNWRSFGGSRDATSNYVGLNYLQICAAAASAGDSSAARIEAGVRRLLRGEAESFGQACVCAEHIFRMSARHVGEPTGGIVVAYEDITPLLRARRERNDSRRSLTHLEREHGARLRNVYEQLGQRLAAIALAARAIEKGGDQANALAIIDVAVQEASQELRMMRDQTVPS
jgi:hypothetical protein